MFEKARRLLRRLLGKGPDPDDGFSGVREPVRRGPPDRADSVALEEPEDS